MLIHKAYAKNIHQIQENNGRLLILNFLFKGKKRLCIIQTYFPSNKQESETYQKQIIPIIKKESRMGSKILIMGDFNAVNNPLTDRTNNKSNISKNRPKPNSWKSEIPLFPCLEDLGFIDVQKNWEEILPTSNQLSFTWSNKNSSSRLDYIWLSSNLALDNIHSFKNKTYNHITNSDHTLLQIKLYKNGITNCPKQATTNRKGLRTIFNFKEMNKEKWKTYAQQIDQEFSKQKIINMIDELFNISNRNNEDNNVSRELSLQDIWNKIETAFKYIGKKTIPQKKIKRSNKPIIKDRGHTKSFKDLRKATYILSLFKSFEKNPSYPIALQIERQTNKLAKRHEIFKNLNINTTSTETQRHNIKTQIVENINILKKINYREESLIREKEIKKSIEKRCQNLLTNQRRMINSLTNQKKNNILLNRILVKDTQEPYIATNKKEVLETTQKHYEEAFKTRSSNFDFLNEDWKREYMPIQDIEPIWYDNLMEPISETEFNQTLKDLPNGKASGTSTICYEMIKKMGSKSKSILRKFLSLCLFKSSCPLSWKTSTIFPIPKARDWECDLTNTRPIILLETTRKLLTKILTNRLSTICKKYNILSGPNYAGLPGESTQEPIHLLNNICEEARNKKKELWICFQDTAKAFDTVNLSMLQKAMERIRIPENAISFIIGFFKNRSLQAITDFGLTQKISAGDGIDQGETISPLLWRIFYDPLLSKIQKNDELGYIMTTKWREDLNYPHEKVMKIRTAATAFMDDTTWIASSRKNMQKILDDAAIFYKANDSQINSKKSVLLAINAAKKDQDKEVLIGPNKEPLKKLDKNEFTRFLGIWIGEKNGKKFTSNLLKREAHQITQALINKKTTDKQILYILNRVLIPRLEYRAQTHFFNEKECTKITAKYMGIFKNSINISKTCPNSIMLHKGIYGLKSMWEIQSEAMISNFANRINCNNDSGTSTIMRLKDYQIAKWEPKNIIREQIKKATIKKDNLQVNILMLAHSYGITFQGDKIQNLFNWQGGIHSIENCINNKKIYQKAIKNLSKHNIMFIDQIIDYNNLILPSWQTLKILLNKNQKGRCPLWFHKVKDQITISHTNNKSNAQYDKLTYKKNYQHEWTNQITTDNRYKEWFVSSSTNQNLIWGKIIDKGNAEKKNKKALVAHHKVNKEEENIFKLIPCKGCNLSNPKYADQDTICKFKLNKDRIKGIKHLNIHIPIDKTITYHRTAIEKNVKEELKNSFIQTHPTTWSPIQPTITTSDLSSSLIKKWIQTEVYVKQLTEAYNNNIHQENTNEKPKYEFYTDGSLKDRSYNQTAMGSAWIQTIGPNPNSTFKLSSENWPSSSRAEILAIFTTLLTVPIERTVEIFTDSQACIDTFRMLSNSHSKLTKRKWLKIKNWTIWTKLLEAIQCKKLSVELTKVKAHNGNFFNEKADMLAKEALISPKIELRNIETGPIISPPTWRELTIDISIREFVKEINKKYINLKWANQNRNITNFSQEIQQEHLYDWEFLWKSQQKNKFFTSFQDSRSKSFWIKIAQDELPTLENLAIRKPNIYKDHQNCPLCGNEKESRLHLFTCPATQEELSTTWEKTKKKILKKFKDNLTGKKATQITSFIDHLHNRATICPHEYIKTSIGIIRKEDAQELEKTFKFSRNKCKTIIHEIFNTFREKFRKIVWKKRCKVIIQMETTLGITKKTKKEKEKITNKRPKRSLSNQNKRKKKKIMSDQSSQQPINDITGTEEPTNISDQMYDKIKDWIKLGKKWLGF